MNETISIIMNRKSQRFFTEKPIEEHEKKTILDCAMRAPTAGNMMLYSVIDVADPEKKKRLSVTCDNQPFIEKASMVLLFLADMQRWYDYFDLCNVPGFAVDHEMTFESPSEADLMLACCDALISAQTAVIAAESMGIGSCYIGDIMEHYEVHRDLFVLPPLVFPITLVVFGHSPEDQRKRKVTSRFPKEFICFTDSYHRLDLNEFDIMFKERNEQFLKKKSDGFIKDVHNLGQQIYRRKTGADFSKEMRRSVRKALENWRSDQ